MKGKTMDMQALFDGISAQAQAERSKYHTTLGELIEALNSADDMTFPVLAKHISGFTSVGEVSSYRGYYTDLALEPSITEITVGELLDALKETLDADLTGYKGGEYTMSADVPVWVSNYGTCDQCAVIDVMHNSENVTLVTKVVEI